MTDAAWTQGMAHLLTAGLPGWPSDPAEAAARSQALRAHLDDLSDEAWLYAAWEAADREKWFPVPGTLREYAELFVSPYPMLPPARTEDERAIDRAETKRGLDRIRAAYEERVKKLPPAPVATMPEPELLVVANDERMDELRRQAAAILEPPAEAPVKEA